MARKLEIHVLPHFGHIQLTELSSRDVEADLDRKRGQRRHPPETELAVCFSCVEALQDAAKHAGPAATGSVRLTEQDGHVSFTLEDDGAGFDPMSAERGAGLHNIADRVSAAGGVSTVGSAPGRGTSISGILPG